MQQLWRQVCSLDICGVKEYLVPRTKHWGQRPSLVIVLYYIFLYLLNCGLGFFNYYLYLLHELTYYFQFRGMLSRFKAYIGGPSGVEQEQSLLDRGMHVVVVLEFCHWQQVIPVILLLIDKQTQILVELLIDMLYLSIGLQMLGYRGDQLNFQQLVEFSYEQSYKLGSTVMTWPND